MLMKILKLMAIIVVINLWFNVSPAEFSKNEQVMEDYDPLVDVSVTLEFIALRALDGIDGNEPDFFLKVFIDGEEYTSPVWRNKSYIYNFWNVSRNVDDYKEIVEIEIQLFELGENGSVLCDIGGENNTLNLRYSIKTGRWSGDDFIGDASGYGRANGCDDGSIYENERDCELYFNIYQNDFDGDGIPYWIEVNEYGTDATINDGSMDYDNDGLPTSWEWRWGFNPFEYENHYVLDYENDGITNFEEYLMSSDPFTKDVFLEIDYMDDGEGCVVTNKAIEMLKNPFHRRNIIFHVEIGESIPFDSFTSQEEVLEIYKNHFLNNESGNWKRSIFHYGIFVNDCFPTGYSFAGDGPAFWGYGPGTNSFVVSISQMKKYDRFRSDIPLDYFIASVIMHEMGHNFGIRFGNPPGCDNQFSKYPWQLGYYIYRNYKSIMNYRYTYKILDYSDGSHGKRDFNDWAHINLSYFELPE